MYLTVVITYIKCSLATADKVGFLQFQNKQASLSGHLTTLQYKRSFWPQFQPQFLFFFGGEGGTAPLDV